MTSSLPPIPGPTGPIGPAGPNGTNGTTAVVTTPVYASTTLGIAGTTSGNLFSVQPSAYTGAAIDVYKNNAGTAVYQFSQPSAGPGQTFDPSTTAAQCGYTWAVTDSNGRRALAIDKAGRIIGNVVSAGTGISVTADPYGRQTVSLTSLGSAPTVNGETLDGSHGGAYGAYVWGVVDSAGKIGVGLKADGTCIIPKFSYTLPAPQLLDPYQVADSTNTLAYTALTGGYMTVYALNKTTGVTVRISNLGNNLSPCVSADGSSVLYMTDRNATQEMYFCPVGGGTEYPVTPLPSIACEGDSLTAGAGGSGGYEVMLAAGLPGRTISNQGVGGQKSLQIAARLGGVIPTVTVTGGSIPTSGSVAVTFATGYEAVTSQGPTSLACTIAGVVGAITGNGTTWTFTPTIYPGSPVTAAGNQNVIVNTGGMDQWIAIYWFGRNDLGDSQAQTKVASAIAGCVAYLKNYTKRFVVLSVLNGASEITGTANYIQIAAINAYLAATYPNNYLDVREYLVTNALAIMAAAGLTVQPADTTAIAGDAAPPSLRADDVHLHQPAYDAIGTQIANFIAAKGW